MAGCRVNCRVDGRTCSSFRPYVLQIDQVQGSASDQNSSGGDDSLLPLCHGSGRLMGSTGHTSNEQQQLICTVKADLVRPSLHQPTEGRVELHVHFASSASNSNIHRLETEQQTQAILSHLILPHLVDTSALCLHPGHLSWRLAVDVHILEAAGGSLLDCATRLISATLLHATRLPHVVVNPPTTPSTTATKEAGHGKNTPNATVSFTVDGDWAKAKPVPGLSSHGDSMSASSSVIAITVAVLLDQDLTRKQRPVYSFVVDPTVQEEDCSMALVHVALLAPKSDEGEADYTVVGVHKTRAGALPMSLLPDICQTAKEAVSQANDSFIIQKASTAGTSKISSMGDDGMTNHHPSTMFRQQFEWYGPESQVGYELSTT